MQNSLEILKNVARYIVTLRTDIKNYSELLPFKEAASMHSTA